MRRSCIARTMSSILVQPRGRHINSALSGVVARIAYSQIRYIRQHYFW